MLRPGDPAPDFALPSDTGETVRLSDLRGRRVVLYFYPKDDTPGCTTEACGFRDRLVAVGGTAEGGTEGDAAAEICVLGVSPDDPASHRRFKEKYDLNFPLLSDPNHRVAEAYGAWGKKKLYGREYEGILRSTFVIGPDGRVERVYEKVRPAGHARRVFEELAAAGSG